MSFTVDYSADKFELGLYNTNFGPVTIANADASSTLDQELSSKLITDMRVTYKFTPNLSLTGIINNAFDVYPDVTDQSTGGTAGGRFLYSSEVSQQGQLGRNYNLSLKYRF